MEKNSKIDIYRYVIRDFGRAIYIYLRLDDIGTYRLVLT